MFLEAIKSLESCNVLSALRTTDLFLIVKDVNITSYANDIAYH